MSGFEGFDAIERAHETLMRSKPRLREVIVPTLVHNVAGEPFLLEQLFDSIDEAQDWIAMRERERLIGDFTD